MGCIKLEILDEQYQKSELKVCSPQKELTFNFFVTDTRKVLVYAYCGNNPISRIDPTGMSWDDVVVKQENGKTVYSATITGVVYNNSSSKVDMNAFKDAAEKQIKKVDNMSGGGFWGVENISPIYKVMGT